MNILCGGLRGMRESTFPDKTTGPVFSPPLLIWYSEYSNSGNNGWSIPLRRFVVYFSAKLLYLYWHCPHNMRSRVYETVRCPSVCPSLCPSTGQHQQNSCCRFAAGRPADRRYIDRLLQQRRAVGECGQCHVVSIRRLLNTDLLIVMPPLSGDLSFISGAPAITVAVFWRPWLST